MPDVKNIPKAAHIWWNDQAEWYFVCSNCYYTYSHMQWAGSTRVPNFQEYKREVYQRLKDEKPDCEWCPTGNHPV